MAAAEENNSCPKLPLEVWHKIVGCLLPDAVPLTVNDEHNNVEPSEQLELVRTLRATSHLIRRAAMDKVWFTMKIPCCEPVLPFNPPLRRWALPLIKRIIYRPHRYIPRIVWWEPDFPNAVSPLLPGIHQARVMFDAIQVVAVDWQFLRPLHLGLEQGQREYFPTEENRPAAHLHAQFAEEFWLPPGAEVVVPCFIVVDEYDIDMSVKGRVEVGWQTGYREPHGDPMQPPLLLALWVKRDDRQRYIVLEDLRPLFVNNAQVVRRIRQLEDMYQEMMEKDGPGSWMPGGPGLSGIEWENKVDYRADWVMVWREFLEIAG